MSLLFPSTGFPSQADQLLGLVGCASAILSFILTFACGLVGTYDGKKFIYGLGAATIATVIDLLAGIFGYVLRPSLLTMPLWATIFGFLVSFVGGVAMGAAGAGVGVAINRARTA